MTLLKRARRSSSGNEPARRAEAPPQDADLAAQLAAARAALEAERARRSELEQQLRESELRREAAEWRERALTSTLPNMAAYRDLDGRFIIVSDSLLAFFQRRREELIGRTADEVFPPQVAALMSRGDDFVRETQGRYYKEAQTASHDGQLTWIETIKQPVLDAAGALVAIASFSHNITARKEVEDALRHQQALLRVILDNAPVAIVLCDTAGQALLVNGTLAGTFMATPEQLVGRELEQLLGPGDAARWAARRERIVATRRAAQTEETIVTPDGIERIVISTEFPVFDHAGRVVAVGGIFLDITNRRRIEDALRHSRQHLEQALWGAGLGLWDWHLPSGRMESNRQLAELLGAEALGGKNLLDLWRDHMHPDDLPATRAGLLAALNGERDAIDAMYRMQRLDGAWAWHLTRGQVVERDGDGRAVRAIGVSQDITARKVAEELLRERARYAHALALCSQALLAGDSGGFEPVLIVALEHLRAATRADRVMVYRQQPQREHGLARLVAATISRTLAPSTLTLPLDLHQSLAAGRAVARPTSALWPAADERAEGQPATSLLIPIHIGARWWGFLKVCDGAPERSWNDDEVQALETAAEMVGSFLQRHETTAMLRRRIGELLTLNQIAQALAMWSDLDRGVEAIGGLVLQLFDAAAVAIWAYDQRADELRKIAAAGCRPQAAALRTLPLAQSPAARELLGRKAAALTRASPDPLLSLRERAGDDDGALLLAPLLMYGAPVGLMVIAPSRPEHLYTPSDMALAQTIAGGLATAIENGRLLATEQRQRRIAESLGRIAVELGRSLDHETVVGAIFTHLGRVLPNDGAAVFLHEENGLILAEGCGISLRHKGRHASLADNPAMRRVCLSGSPFVIGDTEASNEWTNWDNNVPIRSWIATPLRYGSESLGLLSVASLSPHAYSEDDVATLEAFATHAAIAIVNARRYGEAHRDAAEQVRNRLARDLHDSVSQAMLAATRTARVLPQLWELDPDDGRAALHDLMTLVDGAQAEMRTLLLELRPTALARTPLDEALTFLVIGLAAKSGFALSHSLQRTPPLPSDVQVACYRIAQEALHNVVRHAQARHVHVQLEVAPCGHGQHVLTLAVSDDGRGFLPERRRPGGIGIDSMLERAAGIDARIDITSQPGQGTRIMLAWQGGCEPPEADGAIDERA